MEDETKLMIPVSLGLNLDQHLCGENLIFHFTSIDTAVNHIIPNMKLKFGSMENTNDPKEYSGVDPSIERHGGYNDENLLEIIRNTFTQFAFKNVKAICFCRNYKSKAYFKLRMWAQYGCNSSGVCIAFDAQKIKQRLKDIPARNWDGNIRYTKNLSHDRKLLKLLFLNPKDLSDVVNKTIKYAEELIKSSYFKKFHDFKEEAEYRIVATSPEELYLDVSDAIIAIIVGPKTPRCQSEGLVKITPEKIEIQQISWSPYGALMIFLNDPMKRVTTAIYGINNSKSATKNLLLAHTANQK